VTDQQGAVMPGVDVKLTDPSTNITLAAKTNDAGRFTMVDVRPGTYSITFSKTGFSTKRVSSQPVNVGEVLTLNESLEVGQLANVVEVVTSAGAELQTVNASVGTTVSSASLTYLPTFGNDASSLAIFQPGVSPEGSVAGAMNDQNSYQLDGGSNTNNMDGSMTVYTGSYNSRTLPALPRREPRLLAAFCRLHRTRSKNSRFRPPARPPISTAPPARRSARSPSAAPTSSTARRIGFTTPATWARPILG
jgi:hypothetical protein